MKPVPVFGRGFSDEVENLMLIGDADGERELLEGIESTSVQVGGALSACPPMHHAPCMLAGAAHAPRLPNPPQGAARQDP